MDKPHKKLDVWNMAMDLTPDNLSDVGFLSEGRKVRSDESNEKSGAQCSQQYR